MESMALEMGQSKTFLSSVFSYSMSCAIPLLTPGEAIPSKIDSLSKGGTQTSIYHSCSEKCAVRCICMQNYAKDIYVCSKVGYKQI